MPLRDPIVTPNYEIGSIETVLVQVVARDGQFGNGYLWCFEPADSEVLVRMTAAIARFVIGYRGDDVGLVNQEIRRHINFLGYKGVSVFALSAIDMALHDLRLRRADRSLAADRGASVAAVPVYWSGFFLSDPISKWLDEADRVLEMGFTSMKVRVGAPTLDEDRARLEAVRGHVPSGVTLLADAVQRWNPVEAVEAAAALAEFGLAWLEDPVIHSDYAGTAVVVQASMIPIATGENEYLPEGFEELVRTGVPYLLADLQRVGGITGWDGASGIAERSGAVITSHAYPHVAAQLVACAADPAASRVEYVPWWDDLMSYPLQAKDGKVQVPDQRGIGIDWNDDVVERYATCDWDVVGAE